MYGVTLTRFGLHNYRNIACADLDLSRGAVGLIGCNASGKTNIARGAAFFFEDLLKKTCLGAQVVPGKMEVREVKGWKMQPSNPW